MNISEIGSHYLRAHTRIDELVRHLSDEELARSADACPGWSVADVVGHCTGIVEDALAGRLSGPPTDEQAAVQVARHRGRPIGDVLDLWAAGAAEFAELIAALELAPGLIDILSHEQDIRTALEKPGHRDDAGIVLVANYVIAGLDLRPEVIEVVFPDGSKVRSVSGAADGETTAPGKGAEPAVIQLSATPFEVMRFRLGRRSPAEVAALDWSADPTPLLDRLFVFGSRDQSLGE
ncbi:MAG: maleylpyruvate isomerase family mycothiol-dependent enzyme [Acidimicrobiales bacterium]